jgi:hypothetical protein
MTQQLAVTVVLTDKNILSYEEIDNTLNEKLTKSSNSSLILEYFSVISSWPIQEASAIKKLTV